MLMLNTRNQNGNFDEMQVQTRNKVGSQCFYILNFSLLIDLLLKDHGVKWAMSSMSVLVIMLLCAVYYGTRIAWAGAYEGTLTKSKKHMVVGVGLLAAMTTIIAIIRRTNFFREGLNINDGEFLRVFIFSIVFIMIIVVSSIISRRKNNEGND